MRSFKGVHSKIYPKSFKTVQTGKLCKEMTSRMWVCFLRKNLINFHAA